MFYINVHRHDTKFQLHHSPSSIRIMLTPMTCWHKECHFPKMLPKSCAHQLYILLNKAEVSCHRHHTMPKNTGNQKLIIRIPTRPYNKSNGSQQMLASPATHIANMNMNRASLCNGMHIDSYTSNTHEWQILTAHPSHAEASLLVMKEHCCFCGNFMLERNWL